MPVADGNPAPAKLMSLRSKSELARRSCCIWARCETTKVAATPWLNNFTAAPSTTAPTASATNSSIKLKPRLELADVRPIVFPLYRYGEMKVLRTYCLGTLNWGSEYWMVIVTESSVVLGGPPPTGTTGAITIWRVKFVKLLHTSGGHVPT